MNWRNSLIAFSFVLCSFVSFAQELPPYPTNMFSMFLSDHLGPLNPIAPPLKTTNDGRVSLDPQSGAREFKFYLQVPEKLQTHLLKTERGPRILATDIPKMLYLGQNIVPLGGNVEHSTICDPTNQLDDYEGSKFPYACGENNSRDCYEFHVIFSVKLNETFHQIKSVPVKVVVKNPKRSFAEIESVNFNGAVKAGPKFRNIEKFMELITVGNDKRLLVLRTLNSPIKWKNTRTKVKKSGRRDIIYSTYNGPGAGCDVTKWRNFNPISHAPYDNRINKKYGFAKLPFRDSQGNKIKDDAEIYGAYPWLDKNASNLVFLTNQSKLVNPDKKNGGLKSRYNYVCVVPGCEPTSAENLKYFEGQGREKTYAMMGLWTHGKIVTFDSIINSADFGLGILPKYQVKLKLYKEKGRRNGYVRIGGVRQNGSEQDLRTKGLVDNISFIDSHENIFNHLPNMKPMAPRDVVWHMSNGMVTDEIVFDDYMDPHILIYSQMNAAGEVLPGYRQVYDGFPHLSSDFNYKNIRIQNSSSSTSLEIPAYGYLSNKGRIEPVALGGVKGRGLYLDKKTSLVYEIPATNNSKDHVWVASLFVDPRFDSKTPEFKDLITFPNKTKVILRNRNVLRFFSAEKKFYKDIKLPKKLEFKNNQWQHIAIKFYKPNLKKNKQRIQVYIDGFPFKLFDLDFKKNRYFAFDAGKLVVGNRFQGWIDEFKVIRSNLNVEEVCNHGLGTVIGLKKNASGSLKKMADLFPKSVHSSIGKKLGRKGLKYMCYTDYTSRLGVDLNNLPKFTISAREKYTFPEGPVKFNKRRPDSSKNQFCLRCHTADHKVSSMNLSALEKENIDSQYDPRRQPMVHSRKMFGVVPKDYFGKGMPRKDLKFHKDDIGLYIDRFLAR